MGLFNKKNTNKSFKQASCDIKIHDGCSLHKTDEDYFTYAYGPAYVNIQKNADSTWYYTRLNNISRSAENYKSLQECLDAAYSDMIKAKL